MTDKNPGNSSAPPERHEMARSDARFPEEHRNSAADDEISLVDLWLVLLRRRWLIIGVFLTTTACGSGYALLQMTTEENFVTPLQIGQYLGEYGSTRAIEPADELATRLRNSLLPAIRQQVATELAEQDPATATAQEAEPPDVAVELPEEANSSRLVLLQSKAPAAEQDEIELFHSRILEKVKEEHGRQLEIEQNRFQSTLESKRLDLDDFLAERPQRRQDLENNVEDAKAKVEEIKGESSGKRLELEHEIANAESRIKGFKQHNKRLQESIARLEQRRDFLQQREATLVQLIEDFRPAELRSLNETESSNNIATGVMLRGSLTANLHHQLAEVREELLLGLEERHAELESRLEEGQYNLQRVEQERAEKRSKLTQLEARLESQKREAENKLANQELLLNQFEDSFERKVQRKRNELQALEPQQGNFQPTEAAVIASNTGHVDNQQGLIAALSAILGLMLGIFGAFFAELHNRARGILNQQSPEDQMP